MPKTNFIIHFFLQIINISFQEKLMTNFFKIQKKTNFGAILDPFCPNLRKNESSWKKELYQFLNVTIISHRAKN